MKRNVDLVASARRVVLSLLAPVAFAAPAHAGDRAMIDFIGFSPDGRYFAFEEFGIQDGSGLAYSSIYVVDLPGDSWLAGTPIRVRAEEGEDSDDLVSVRARAEADAGDILAQSQIVVPAQISVLNGDGWSGEYVPDLAFSFPTPDWGIATDDYTLELAEFPLTSPEDCESYFGSAPLGFELRLVSDDGSVVLHRDEGQLPRSRGCPQGYGQYAVVVPGIGSTAEVGVAIVAYYPGGFEGPDRRFLAVPLAF